MSILNLMLVIIILLLAVYCVRLKLRQQNHDTNKTTHSGLGLLASNHDIMECIRQTVNNFKEFLEARQVELYIKCTPESMMGWIDTDNLDKMIVLLLSDMSRKASPGNKISVDVNTNKHFDCVIIHIDDNSAAVLRTSLVLVQQLVYLHHGSVRSEHYSEQGNKVIIELPIKKDVLQSEQIVSQEADSTTPFHIPSNIELNVPTIELPAGYDTGEQSREALVQQAYNSPDQKFLQRAIQCINDHIDDSDYDRDAFAADMGASASTLYNKLRAITGMNVTAFIREIRIKTACRMAKENPELRVSDIAYRVGFKDPKYFATTFKKVMNAQPKEYFEKLRSD